MDEKRDIRRSVTASVTGVLFAYIYSMILSRLLVGEPTTGGAMFMCGRLAVMFTTGLTPGGKSLMPRGMHIGISVGTAGLLLINLALMMLYPPAASPALCWLMFGMILSLILSDTFGQRLVRFGRSRGMSRVRFLLLYASVQLLLLIAGLTILMASIGNGNGWMMTGGYYLVMAVLIYDQLKRWLAHDAAEDDTPEAVRNARDTMKRSRAFTVYEALTTLITVAFHLTLVMLYTFLAMTAEQLLIAMSIALGVTLAGREISDALNTRLQRRRVTDPINVMTVGLFLWLYGLLLADSALRGGAPEPAGIYLCLAVCTGGVTLCALGADRMESDMQRVGRFAAGRTVQGYRALREADLELSALAGQVLSLSCLTAFEIVSRLNFGTDCVGILSGFRPLMILPALIVVIVAILASLRYPISRTYSEKLRRFLRIREEGSDNGALEKQISGVVTGRRGRPIGTHILMAVLRPFLRHRLQGQENIVRDDENPIVFLCNHSEIYGPVTGVLFIPVHVRPWVISEIVVNEREMADYVYKYNVSQMTWIPQKLRMPICEKILAPLCLAIMNQLEAIPVYRNKPTMLMKTFRQSVEAMESGDNLLIYPENPNAVAEDHGYEHEGVGELFSGFALLAQVYWNKTGKRCRFLPMYCHKHMRTMTFGRPIVFDPDNDPNQERERISREAYETMTRICAEEDAKWARRQAERRGRKHTDT